jgi:hypothetical protein
MDNASNLLTSLLSGGSMGSMPIVEGAVSDQFGKPLFFALYDWFLEHGPVYKLAFGPKAFVVVSDPIVTHHILRENAFGYDKACFKLYVLHTQSQQSHFKDEEQYVHVVVRSFCWTL